MEDIILVTGRDLASSWTNVVFSENQGGEQVSFGVQVTGISSCNVQWQVPLEDIRGVAVNCGPSGQNLPEDQCIFVRGFRVRRRFRIIPRLRAAAEPTLDPDRDEDDFDEQLISTPLETDYQDPLHTLLDYLVTVNAVLGNLRNSRPGIWWAQCAFAEGGPEVESSAAKINISLQQKIRTPAN
ncbi:hypothetical protein BGW80DRAFT_655413 [Lactifluus volemus]|nr:hypothetical protein BGW80DRAFT_655413 [Lactifluus volemus]